MMPREMRNLAAALKRNGHEITALMIADAADDTERLMSRVAELEGVCALIRVLTERRQLPLTAQINTVAHNALERT